MSEQELLPDDSGAIQVDSGNLVPKKRALSSVERILTNTDLKQPGVQKLILDQLDTAEAAIERLERYRGDFHETS